MRFDMLTPLINDLIHTRIIPVIVQRVLQMIISSWQWRDIKSFVSCNRKVISGDGDRLARCTTHSSSFEEVCPLQDEKQIIAII